MDKLSAERATNFICRVLSAFGKSKMNFSGTFAISSGQLKTITFIKTLNDKF